MSHYEAEVRFFHQVFGHPCPKLPTTPPKGWVEARKKLLREEVKELCDALDSGDMDKIARESVDCIYVALGTMVGHGLPLRPIWRFVHHANMQKEPAGPTEKPKKPEGWPDPQEQIRLFLETYTYP